MLIVEFIIPKACNLVKLFESENGTQIESNRYSTIIGNCKLLSGKWYFEIKLLTTQYANVGWMV